MNTTQTHTPTPWFQLSGHVISHTVTADHARDENLVVPGGILSAADAAHIVRCVNSHEALVETLEKAVNRLYDLTPFGDSDKTRALIAELKAALAQAEQP